MTSTRSRAAKPAGAPSLYEAARYVGRLLMMLRPYWGAIAKGMTLGLAVALLGMISPILAKLFFDRVYPARDATLLEVLVVGALTVAIANAALGGIKYYTQLIGARLARAVSLAFFNHLQHLHSRFFDEHRVGEIGSRFQDVRTSLDTLTRALDTLFISGAYVLLIPPILLLLNVKLALLAFIAVPVTCSISALSGQAVRELSKQAMEANAEFSAFQFETLSHIRSLKVLAAEHHVFRAASEQLHRTQQLQLKTAAVAAFVAAMNAAVRALGQAVLSWVAWTLILQQQISLGDFVAFTAYTSALSGPVGQFTSLFVSFQQSAVSLSRMFEYFDLPAEQDPSHAFEAPVAVRQRMRGAIVFSNVRLGYSRERLILDDLSFTIAANSIAAIVGPSGAGKSSVLRLLCKMESPSAGGIRIGASDLASIALSDVRRQVAVVWQEFSVMRGTVRENLTIGLPSVSAGATRRSGENMSPRGCH